MQNCGIFIKSDLVKKNTHTQQSGMFLKTVDVIKH